MNYAEIKTLTLSYADRQDDLELSNSMVILDGEKVQLKLLAHVEFWVDNLSDN